MTDFERQIRVASGYCDLGMWLEANEAVEDIAPGYRLRVPVLVLRERIYGSEQPTCTKRW